LQVGQDDVGGIVQELNTVDEAKTDLSENQTFEFNEGRAETEQNVGGQQDVGVDFQDGVFGTARNTTNDNPAVGRTQ